ncbi:MBL fold metallo-hydrolase [Elusimicrobiota bacterium]
MKIKFWGSRGAIPVPDGRMIKYGGNTSCVEVSIGSNTMILDAGTGIRKLGEQIKKRKIRNMDIFITHSHWDHIQGFPFFTPIYSKESNINIFGSTKSYKHIKDSLVNQMSQEFFPVRFSDLKSRINFIEIHEGSTEMYDYRIKTMQTNHPIYTLGIRIEKNNNSFVYITDNELCSEKPQSSWNDFVQFVGEATYLIHDAQFTKSEYNKRRGWGHSSYRDVIQLAVDAGVKNLGFFHHDPDRRDIELDKIEKKYQGVCKEKKYNFKVFAVKEQEEITLTK